MEVKKMENFIEASRKVFRNIVERNSRREVLMTFLHDALKECCSQFEEDTLIENLAEEYKVYLKELAAA